MGKKGFHIETHLSSMSLNVDFKYNQVWLKIHYFLSINAVLLFLCPQKYQGTDA